MMSKLVRKSSLRSPRRPSHLAMFGQHASACALAAACWASPGAAQSVNPLSVVYIECTFENETHKGSGVVIDLDGRLLTAKHIVPGMAADCKGALGTQSDPSAMKLLDVRHIAADHDAALLQFVENRLFSFVPVSYDGGARVEEGLDVVGYGFHDENRGLPTREDGRIKSADVLQGGKVEAGLNTTPGMSGGPVLLDDKLIGLISGEPFDALGEAIASRLVLVNQLPSEILRWLQDQTLAPAGIRDSILSEQLALNDLCTQLLREQISHRGERFPRAAEIAASMVEDSSSLLTEDAPYWVTVTTGPAKWADCRSGNLLKAMYFPMGMMVRPERDVLIAGETHTLFLTEHGLRIFLDREAIEPITPEVGYVFASANGVFQVCKRNEENCDPYREYRLTEHDRHWPFLSGYQYYLRTEDVADLDIARVQLKEMYDYQQDPPIPGDPFAEFLDLETPASIDACRVREAWLYTFLSRFDDAHPQKGSEYFYPVRYSLCTVRDGSAFNRFRRVKLVTAASAEVRFSQLWAVNTLRKLPDNIQKATKALFDLERPFADVFKCGESRDGKTTAGRASRVSERSNLSEIMRSDIDRHSVFRQFQVAQALSPVDIFKTAPLFNDIELSVICGENDELRNAGNIIIDLAPLSDDLTLEVRLNDLYDALKESFDNLGMVDGSVLNKRLREGIMYRICDFHEYIAWRTILFNEIKDKHQVRQAKDVMGVDLDLMADHITHLIMASVFSTDVKLRNSENKRQGCV